MNDPWTSKTVWEQTVGAGEASELGRGGQWGENWDNYNRITIQKQ